MCARLAQQAAACGKDELFALDRGLQGHPWAEEPSGDQTPTLLFGSSWAGKPGLSRASGQPFTRELFGPGQKCSRSQISQTFWQFSHVQYLWHTKPFSRCADNSESGGGMLAGQRE